MVPGPDTVIIEPARSDSDLQQASALFEAYAASLEVDLAYQGFQAELASLPGSYAPPGGELLIARDSSRRALGCIALRPLGGTSAEIKRLYVGPSARGTGLGRKLAQAIIGVATGLGYVEVRLDTLPEMTEAQRLYESLGFVGSAPHYLTPVAGTLFLRLAV